MKYKKKICFRTMVSVVYFMMLFTMLSIIVTISIGRDKDEVSFGLHEYESVLHDWVDESGNSFDFSDIDKYYDAKKEYIFAYYNRNELKNNIPVSLFFRSKNTYVTVFEDEEEVYETEVANHRFYNNSPGTRWNLVYINPDTKTIKLQIRLAYHDERSKVDNFYIGDRARIVIKTIQQKVFGIIVSFLIFIVGIILLLFDVTMNWRNSKKEHSLFYLGLFSIIVALWSMLETNILQLFCADLRILQVMNNMLLVVGSIPVYLFLDCIFGMFQLKFMKALCFFDIIYIVLSTISQLCGLWDYHQTLNGAVLNFGIVSTAVICCVIYSSIKDKSKKESRSWHLSQQLGIAAIGLGLAGDFYRYLMMDVMDRAMFIRVGLLLFILCFSISSILAERSRAESLRKKELELVNSRIDIMLSQIQPHFLYNTLNTIENLCNKDEIQAARLVRDFANYLRDNMDSLKQKELIPFERELEHIKVYLEIEKLRFEERLNIEFDFETTDFFLPILTVQPLVENAVRYGLTKKFKGGTVTISTRRESRGIQIIVADDGVGFDVMKTKQDGRSHVGIENVRNRLDAQCGGTLKIESIKDVGTTATVLIPKEEQMDR